MSATWFTAMTRIAQEKLGLVVDGACGPKTRAALETWDRERLAALEPDELSIDADGWLVGRGVVRIPSNDSWFGGKLNGGKPAAIVAHYTATDGGTGVRMARNRADFDRSHFADPKTGHMPGSWHLTIEQDGTLIQLIPFDTVAYHAGAPTAKPIPGLARANQCSIGIEFVGHGRAFPGKQIDAACRVWPLLVKHYGIERACGMVQHSELDPTRRSDPGKVFMTKHAPRILTSSYT